jgi:hypothetical protein
VIAIALVLGLTSCASPAEPDRLPPTVVSSQTADSGPVPQFSGPAAREFENAYRSTTSALVHKILAKGFITDQDYSVVSDEYVKCLKDRGYVAHIDGPAGQATVSGGPARGDANAANAACSDELAVVASLRGESAPPR